jgi:hypothetical protein
LSQPFDIGEILRAAGSKLVPNQVVATDDIDNEVVDADLHSSLPRLIEVDTIDRGDGDGRTDGL